jgi:hypothetical protein
MPVLKIESSLKWNGWRIVHYSVPSSYTTKDSKRFSCSFCRFSSISLQPMFVFVYLWKLSKIKEPLVLGISKCLRELMVFSHHNQHRTGSSNRSLFDWFIDFWGLWTRIRIGSRSWEPHHGFIWELVLWILRGSRLYILENCPENLQLSVSISDDSPEQIWTSVGWRSTYEHTSRFLP